MITKREANTIVESVIEELAEQGYWVGDFDRKAGEVVATMLKPVTEEG